MVKTTDHAYSQNITNKKLAVLGLYPPPYGGVSVHIRRVVDQFLQQHNKVYLFNTEQRVRSLFFPLYLLKLVAWIVYQRPDYLYYHSTYLRLSIVELVLMAVLKPLLRYGLIIVEHDCRHLYSRSSRYKRIYQWIVRGKNCRVVCIGVSTWNSYCDNKIEPAQYCVESAFLPPVTSVASLVRETYPSSLFTFLNDCTPLIVASAAHAMLVDGKDVYGLDLCIAMLAEIKDTYPDAGLIIGLPQVNNTEYFAVLERRMRELGVAELVYVLHGNKELWPLFENVDLFVRPTLSDGDSVSIREALYFNIPVVASDVCERPDKVYLFKMGDTHDFGLCVKKTLQKCVYERELL